MMLFDWVLFFFFFIIRAVAPCKETFFHFSCDPLFFWEEIGDDCRSDFQFSSVFLKSINVQVVQVDFFLMICSDDGFYFVDLVKLLLKEVLIPLQHGNPLGLSTLLCLAQELIQKYQLRYIPCPGISLLSNYMLPILSLFPAISFPPLCNG